MNYYLHVVILMSKHYSTFNFTIISKLLHSVLNWPEKLLVSMILDNSNKATCFKTLIDPKGLVICLIGLLAIPANSRGEALNIWPILKQINKRAKDI